MRIKCGGGQADDDDDDDGPRITRMLSPPKPSRSTCQVFRVDLEVKYLDCDPTNPLSFGPSSTIMPSYMQGNQIVDDADLCPSWDIRIIIIEIINLERVEDLPPFKSFFLFLF